MMLAAAGVIIGLTVFYSAPSRTASTNLQAGSGQSEVVEVPDNTAKAGADQAPLTGSDTAQPAANPDANRPAQKGTGSSLKDHPSACRAVIKDLVHDYKDKLKQQDDLLDSRLEYPVSGSNITIRHIRTYNQTVEKLYAQYVTTARDQGCTFPESAPQPLPEKYNR